jgi:hypothetical protein
MKPSTPLHKKERGKKKKKHKARGSKYHGLVFVLVSLRNTCSAFKDISSKCRASDWIGWFGTRCTARSISVPRFSLLCHIPVLRKWKGYSRQHFCSMKVISCGGCKIYWVICWLRKDTSQQDSHHTKYF